MRSRTRERAHETPAEGSNASSRGRRSRGRSSRKGTASSERGRSPDKDGANRREGESDGGGQSRSNRRSKGKGRKRSAPSNRRNQRPQRGDELAKFWGAAADLPSLGSDIRITDDPAAVPRSLGPPPLPGHEVIAQHYFKAVYDRAVTTAGALAAVGGLIDPETLAEEIQH